MSRRDGDRCAVRARPDGVYAGFMSFAASMGHRMSTAIVKDHQHEFSVVWQALHVISQSTPPGDLLRLEVQRASDALLYLMRVAGCIEPVTYPTETRAPETLVTAV